MNKLTLSVYTLLIMILVSAAVLSCSVYFVDDPGNLVPKTVDEDPSLPFIEVNGTKLHGETFGDPADPVCIVLHGGPGGDYRSMLKFKAMADIGYYVVFYDQRGAGLSRRHNPDVFTTETYLEDLRQIILYFRTSPSQKVILLGHSWGAMYATMYVNTYPEDIQGLILSEPGGFTDEQVGDYEQRLFEIDILAEWLNDVTWDDLFVNSDSHEAQDYRYQTAVANEPNTGASSTEPIPQWRVGAVCGAALRENTPDYDWTTNLSDFTTEVLFLYSENNSSYGLAHARRVSSGYPNVRLEMVSGTGHDMEYNGFDEYFIYVQDYLNHLGV